MTARQSSSEGAIPAVETTVRQASPIIADYEGCFLVAHVSKDGKIVGIDHPCDALWSDVMIAHVALRDRINERIAAQDGCPFKPKSTPPAGSQRGDDALREALMRVRQWAASLTVTDMNEIVADGGITAGMVVGQEASEQVRRIDRALATPVPHKADEGVEIPAGLREAMARALWSDFVDQHGYPNGLPTWDELPEEMPRRVQPATKGFMLSLADAAIATLSPAPCLSDERVKLEAEIFRLRDVLKTIRLEIGPAKAYAEECGLPGGKFPSAVHIKLDLIDGYARAALDTPSTGEEGK